jgi:hypothetical protein
MVQGLVFEQHGIEVGGHGATTGPMHPAPALTPHALPSALSTAGILAAALDFRGAGFPPPWTESRPWYSPDEAAAQLLQFSAAVQC